MIAVVFPGQGSQFVGMGRDFYENFLYLKPLYEEASEILNYDIKKIIFESDKDVLSKTEYTQPSVFLTSYVIFEVLNNNFPKLKENIKFVAGHSLGEYTAMCVSKALNFKESFKLVSIRAKIMSEVSKKKPGGMLAVLDISKQEIINFCNEIKSLGFVVEPVNFNTQSQIVVAGEIEGINKLQTLLNEKKIKNIKLNVSGAFHSSLMDEAQNIFAEILDEFHFEDAVIPIVMNYDAKPHKERKEILENLKLQINHPVLWEDSIRYMYKEGIKIFIECGPGKILSGMIKKILSQQDIKIYNIDTIENLNLTIDNLKEFF